MKRTQAGSIKFGRDGLYILEKFVKRLFKHGYKLRKCVEAIKVLVQTIIHIDILGSEISRSKIYFTTKLYGVDILLKGSTSIF